MFKKCCGCKNPADKKSGGEKEKKKEAEAYGKGGEKEEKREVKEIKREGEVVVAPTLKSPTVAEPLRKESQQRRTASFRAPAAEEVKPKEEVEVREIVTVTVDEAEETAETKDSTPSGDGSAATATAATATPAGDDLSAESKPASPEPEVAATLRAFARGAVPTPHPSKRSGSVPAIGYIPQWLSQEDDDDDVFAEGGGATEPPATPVGRDELALRRHRFFSELLTAHQAAAEHRVRFDPLGPVVAGGSEHDQRTSTVEFEALLSRLERVTTRLEQTVVLAEEALKRQVAESGPQDAAKAAEEAQGIVLQDPPQAAHQPRKPAQLTESVQLTEPEPPCASAEEAPLPPTPPVPPAPPLPPTSSFPRRSLTGAPADMSVQGFQDILSGPFASFLTSSSKIGGDVASIANLVNQAFQTQLQYLKFAAQSPPPSQDQNMKLLEPTSMQIRAVQEYREKHRGSPFFNHLSAVSESVAALGWVTVSPTPAPYVKEMNDAGQFYTNRVLKEWKEKDKTHKVWVDAWVETLTELQKFVKQHHTTGLVWGGKATGGAVPPPPPPGLPPPPPEMPIGDLPPGTEQDRSALFAEINRGEAVTSALKKVTPDMQTHKNPALRSGPAPFKAPTHVSTFRPVAAPTQAVPDKPPTFVKEGKKWLIEYQKGNPSLVVDQTEMNNVIYMFKCSESTLTVKGKVNSIVLDSCRKSSVVFDAVVSSVEFVNCQSVQMQVLGKVPTISIDKTDGCQMYLSPESVDVVIVSAKSSEMNVMVPKPNGDYLEHPVPEQFKTTLTPKGLLTVAVENKGWHKIHSSKKGGSKNSEPSKFAVAQYAAVAKPVSEKLSKSCCTLV